MDQHHVRWLKTTRPLNWAIGWSWRIAHDAIQSRSPEPALCPRHPRSGPFMNGTPVEDLAEALGEGIVTGHAAMPQFVFEPYQVGAIIAYLRTLEP